jgi:hypothetical protein
MRQDVKMSMAVLATARSPSAARRKYRDPQADRSRGGTGLGVAGAVQIAWKMSMTVLAPACSPSAAWCKYRDPPADNSREWDGSRAGWCSANCLEDEHGSPSTSLLASAQMKAFSLSRRTR